MTSTITLTREQWDGIWDAISQIRASAGDMDMAQHTLRDVGLDKPADRLSRRLDEIFTCASAIESILIDLTDAMSDEPREVTP